MDRLLTSAILSDLNRKMVFITGPRQVGKTWLAKQVAACSGREFLYLNYDSAEHRDIILRLGWLPSVELLILDEIHKMDSWRGFMKGVYDTRLPHLQILVTGSARLGAFRNRGDSLAGRFFRHRLMPFSPLELSRVEDQRQPFEQLQRLQNRGGFPEPYLVEDDVDSQRWRKSYLDGLIRLDVLDFERVHELRKMQLVLELLQARVGSLVSFNSIANDVGLSPVTVQRYVEIFEDLFIVFCVRPYVKNIARAVRKAPKIYFYDTGLVTNGSGARLENLVALSLLGHCFEAEDMAGKNLELRYLRTKAGHEVDFCLVENGDARQLIEVKSSPIKSIPAATGYFSKRYPIPNVVLCQNLGQDYVQDNVEVRDLGKWITRSALAQP